MKIFKKLIHGGNRTSFQTYTKKEDFVKMSATITGALTDKIIEKLVSSNQNGLEVAMMINQSNGNGRRVSAVTKINVLFADFDDGKKSLDLLLSLPIAPHLIIESSPRKFHTYWLITGCAVEEFTQVMKALAKKLGSDPSVADLVRVMRMPGTFNWKYDNPFLVKIVHIQNDANPIPLKLFIKNMKLSFDVKSETVNNVKNLKEKLSREMAVHIVQELEHLSADDRDIWQKIGMAIHSLNNSERGYKIWEDWSKKSDKFDEADQRKRWKEFKPKKGINIQTLFWLTNQAKNGGNGKIDEMVLAGFFKDKFKHQLRYDRDIKNWYQFNGVVWKIDAQSPIRLARQMVLELSKDSNNSFKSFRSAGALKGIVNHAELVDDLQINHKKFDVNQKYFATNNGVINLVTGNYRTAKATDFLLRCADVAFDEAAKCPQWLAFMKSITKNDKELQKFIQLALGYTLFGHAELQLFFLVIGSGSNGKGVFMRTLQKLLGDYALSVQPNLLTTAYGGNVNSPSPAIARLNGARMVVCTELPTGKKFDEAFVKQYAGGDEIIARHGYGESFSFKPEGKLWLSTNEIPELVANDLAIWRRLMPVPFNATFLGDKVDSKLEEKLSRESAGILNWLLSGANSFAHNGLGTCDAVEKLKARMKHEADSLLLWLSDSCVQAKGKKTQSSLAFENYVDFMNSQNKKPLTIQRFHSGLVAKGFKSKRSGGFNFYDGFSLR